MKLQEIHTLAQQHDIEPGSLSKADLIREIQQQEGNFDCFASARNQECDQLDCKWRDDCFALSRE